MDYIAVVEILTGAEIFTILRVGPVAGIAVPGSAGIDRMEARSSPLARRPHFDERTRRTALPHDTAFRRHLLFSFIQRQLSTYVIELFQYQREIGEHLFVILLFT